jgi:hypothetical protein
VSRSKAFGSPPGPGSKLLAVLDRLKTKRTLQWSASHTHPFDWKIKRPAWPPFYATAFFLPRVKVRIRNDGPVIHRLSISIEVREYDGPIGDAPSIKEGWIDTHHAGRYAVGTGKGPPFQVHRRKSHDSEGRYVHPSHANHEMGSSGHVL